MPSVCGSVAIAGLHWRALSTIRSAICAVGASSPTVSRWAKTARPAGSASSWPPKALACWFDNLGLGHSEGDWGDGSFSHKVADTVRAVQFMNASGREVRLLVGHSFGGAAVIAAAHDCQTVAALASIGAPFVPAHVERIYDTLVHRIVTVLAKEFGVSRQTVYNYAA